MELIGKPASEVADATNWTEVPIVEPLPGALTDTPAKAETLESAKTSTANRDEDNR